MNKHQPHILRYADKGLLISVVLAVCCEMLFFPTLSNFYGCIMAIISYVVFSYFLKEKYVRFFPFAFLMYLSMFMYRYLPLIATLAEGKPITYGFERPYETFIYEIILFLISSLAFYLACGKPSYKKKNNLIQKSLFKVGFFQITPAILWGIGLIGLTIRLYNFSSDEVAYGDVGGKFLLGLDYLMYAPLCMFFPSLLNLNYTNKKVLFVYTAIIFIINIASNSRQSIITPIAIVLILFFLHLVINKLKVTTYIPPIKILFLGLFLLFILNILSNVSLAMLYTRSVRNDLSKMELFEQTVKVSQDEALMKRLKDNKDEKESKLTSYNQGWTENYLNNFMLARYANMRITDETLFYAEKKGYGNRQMQESFTLAIMALFPTPVLRFLDIDLDKTKLEFSRGDLLYGSGFSGYRVTSHVGDGLATFGFWYFPFQFIALYLVFKLLNCLMFYSRKGIKYAPFALMNVFAFLGMFRNAQGIFADISYIVRGFLQGIITYLIIFYLVRLVLNSINPKYVINKETKYELNTNLK